MNYNYSVRFNWSGDYTKTWQFSFLKQNFETEFVKIYNEACDALNPHYETWNEEFESLYPDGKTDNDEMDPLYENYLRDKQNEILSTLDNKVFKLYSGDKCQICGKLIDYDAEVFITLVPPANK